MKKKLLALIATAAALSLVAGGLAACGGSDNTDSTGGGSGSGTGGNNPPPAKTALTETEWKSVFTETAKSYKADIAQEIDNEGYKNSMGYVVTVDGVKLKVEEPEEMGTIYFDYVKDTKITGYTAGGADYAYALKTEVPYAAEPAEDSTDPDEYIAYANWLRAYGMYEQMLSGTCYDFSNDYAKFTYDSTNDKYTVNNNITIEEDTEKGTSTVIKSGYITVKSGKLDKAVFNVEDTDVYEIYEDVYRTSVTNIDVTITYSYPTGGITFPTVITGDFTEVDAAGTALGEKKVTVVGNMLMDGEEEIGELSYSTTYKAFYDDDMYVVPISESVVRVIDWASEDYTGEITVSYMAKGTTLSDADKATIAADKAAYDVTKGGVDASGWNNLVNYAGDFSARIDANNNGDSYSYEINKKGDAVIMVMPSAVGGTESTVFVYDSATQGLKTAFCDGYISEYVHYDELSKTSEGYTNAKEAYDEAKATKVAGFLDSQFAKFQYNAFAGRYYLKADEQLGISLTGTGETVTVTSGYIEVEDGKIVAYRFMGEGHEIDDEWFGPMTVYDLYDGDVRYDQKLELPKEIVGSYNMVEAERDETGSGLKKAVITNKTNIAMEVKEDAIVVTVTMPGANDTSVVYEGEATGTGASSYTVDLTNKANAEDKILNCAFMYNGNGLFKVVIPGKEGADTIIVFVPSSVTTLTEEMKQSLLWLLPDDMPLGE